MGLGIDYSDYQSIPRDKVDLSVRFLTERYGGDINDFVNDSLFIKNGRSF